MPQIVITNFTEQTHDYKEGVWDQKKGVGENLHAWIVNGLGKLALFKKKGANALPIADGDVPLVMSPGQNSPTITGLSGAALTMCWNDLSSGSILGAVAVITDTFHIYLYDFSTGSPAVHSLGQPTNPSNTGNADIIEYNGHIIASHFFGGMYHMGPANFASPSWTNITNPTGGSLSACNHHLETFLSNTYYVDSDQSSTAWPDRVDIIQTSFTTIAGLSLGFPWYILGLRNYNSNYLAVFAMIGNPGTPGSTGINGGSGSWMFLWNGQNGSSYDYAIPLPGYHVGSFIVDGTLYMLQQIQGFDTAVYVLDGLVPKLYDYFSNVLVDLSSLTAYRQRIAYDGNVVYIPTISGNVSGSSILAYDPRTKQSWIVINTTSSQFSSGQCSALLAFDNFADYLVILRNNSNIYFWSVNLGGITGSLTTYQSNPIQLPTRGTINRASVYMLNASTSTDQQMQLTLKSRDIFDPNYLASYGGNYLSQTSPVYNSDGSISSGGLNGVVMGTYNLWDNIGAAATSFLITLTLTTGTAWTPIIYMIVIDWEPAEQNS